jgi:hypothetical protein
MNPFHRSKILSQSVLSEVIAAVIFLPMGGEGLAVEEYSFVLQSQRHWRDHMGNADIRYHSKCRVYEDDTLSLPIIH